MRNTEGDSPLNVSSVSDEEIGRDMSNFGEFPFYMGRSRSGTTASRAFYQMLTEPDEKVRKSIAKMPGKEAKRSGKSQTVEAKFDGTTCSRFGGEPRADQRRNPRQARAESGTVPPFRRDPSAADCSRDSGK
jgi:hypothetical protein